MIGTTNALRRVRKARALTLEDVADLVDVHCSTVHHWEYGRMRPYPKSLHKLEVLFGMTADELLAPGNGNGGPKAAAASGGPTTNAASDFTKSAGAPSALEERSAAAVGDEPTVAGAPETLEAASAA